MPTPIWVNLIPGPDEPEESAFSSTRGLGTPIIIDASTGAAYYYNPTLGVSLLGNGNITYIQLNGDFSTTSPLAQTTPISFTPEANSTYIIEGQIGLETDSAVKGPVLTLQLPSGLETGFAVLRGAYSASAERLSAGGTLSNPSLAVTGLPADTPLPASFQITLRTGGSPSGNFSLALSVEP